MADNVAHIKRSRKEATLHKIISTLFMQIRLEDDRLNNIFINRVHLSPNKSTCHVLFYSPGGPEEFKKSIQILKLYKPSMRKALADSTRSRYVPDLYFEYDAQFEKQQELENLLNNVEVELDKEDE